MEMEKVIWILSSNCNLRCKHCYTSRFESKVFPKEYYLQVLDEIVENKINKIGLTGGEPLLFPYFKELIKRCSGKNLEITLATNGTLLNEKWIEVLNPLKSNLSIFFSLDGTEKTHEFLRGKENFRKVMNAFDLLSKTDFDFNVMSSIGTLNWNQTDEILKICLDKGVKSVIFIPIMDSGNACRNKLSVDGLTLVKSIEKAVKFAENNKYHIGIWCSTFIRKFLTNPFLTIYKCRPSPVIDISPDFDILLCDIIDIKIANIIKEGKFEKAVEKVKKFNLEKVQRKPCIDCENYEFCYGGCFARSYLKYGRLDLPDPLCPDVCNLQ